MKSITLNHITKVEGHGSLEVEIDNGKVIKCNLKSVEGARFFEGLVVGRYYNEVPEITSRICGICSCAHTIASIRAIENALNIKVTQQTKILREILTIGERIRSHATHLYFLALPDYLNYESAIAMTKDHKKEVERALRLIKLGNDLVSNIGAREMHPTTTIIGGITHYPDELIKTNLKQRCKDAIKDCFETIELFTKLPYPKYERKCEHISLKQLDSFPLIEGTIVSTNELNIDAKYYKSYFKEYIEDYSTAKFAVREGKSYMTGALSRVNNNYKLLSNETLKQIKKHKLTFPDFNPFHNNICQALELLHWTERAIQILDSEFKHEEPIKAELNKTEEGKKYSGISAVEAPRGILFHEYELDENGKVLKCNIITPTVQNLRNMENDIKDYLNILLQQNKTPEEIVLEIEKLIRAYDPCFSCSTHFLKVKWTENGNVKEIN